MVQRPNTSRGNPVIHTARLFFVCAFLLLLLAGVYAAAASGEAEQEFPVARPPLTPGIFPCSSCHADMEADTKKRELSEHTDIELKHAVDLMWCFSCHDVKNRDKLRLVNGDLIEFTQTYRLCGQCHVTQYRDWRAGIHGKRTGHFANGPRTYQLCVHCHDPHNPKFKPMKPEPPPLKPLDQKHG
jgi:hypothetical protein